MKVLLLEDNPVTKDGLAILLRQAGLDVATAGHGAEALRVMREGFHPDAVLLDLNLPGISADTFVQNIKGRPRASLRAPDAIPVVVFTAGDATEWEQRGFRVVHKPMEVSELVDALNHAVEDSSQAKAYD